MTEFKDTKEQREELLKVLAIQKSVPGGIMPALQAAQEIYGYLPKPVLQTVSQELCMPMAEIYGIVTFYSQFSLVPKGKYNISVCLGTACYVKGAGNIFNDFASKLDLKDGQCAPDGVFSLESCRCIGACGLAPVLTVNDEVYGKLTLNDVDKIIEKYKAQAQALTQLIIDNG